MMAKSTQTRHPLLSEQSQRDMDALCHYPLREDNYVSLLSSGVESYQYRWALLEKAEKTIHMVAFSMMRDETSYKLRDLLIKKLNQGVEVKLIFDDAVMWSTLSGNIVKDLESAGAKVIRYHKLFNHLRPNLSAGKPFKQLAQIFKYKLKRRYHEKYMIIDGREVILGGINWGNKYAHGGIRTKAWHDSDAYMTGPVVEDIQHQFHKDFDRYQSIDTELVKALGQTLPVLDIAHPETEVVHKPSGITQARYVAHKPYDDNELVMTNAYLYALQHAQDFIYWGCHGIRPPRVLAEALIAAVERGVDVRLYTNSKHASRTLMMRGLLGWMYWESSLHFHELIKRGVKIYTWQKAGAYHSKNLVIDDVFASVGSYNIARGSAFHHTESNIFVSGGDFPIAVRKQFTLTEKDCKRLTLKDVKSPPDFFDPYRRPMSERNRLIKPELMPETLRASLD